MYFSFQLNGASSRVPPNTQVVLVDLVTSGFVSSTLCMTTHPVQPDPPGMTLLAFYSLVSKYCLHVNSSNVLIGFSPNVFFFATLQSSRFALANLSWAYSSSQSLVRARPSVSWLGLRCTELQAIRGPFFFYSTLYSV